MERKRIVVVGGLLFLAILSISLVSARSLQKGQSAGWERESISLPVRRDAMVQGAAKLAAPTPTLVKATQSEHNCTFGLYYWLDRPELWPEQVTIGGQSFSKDQGAELLKAEWGIAYNDLIRQVFIANINIQHGADGNRIERLLEDADGWLRENPPERPMSAFNRQRAVELSALLTGFNNGDDYPGPCEGQVPAPTIQAGGSGMSAPEAGHSSSAGRKKTRRLKPEDGQPSPTLVVAPAKTEKPPDRDPKPAQTPKPADNGGDGKGNTDNKGGKDKKGDQGSKDDKGGKDNKGDKGGKDGKGGKGDKGNPGGGGKGGGKGGD